MRVRQPRLTDHGAELGGARVRRLGVVFFFQAEDGIRDLTVTGVQTCALPISGMSVTASPAAAAMEYVLVNASGANSRPSWACSVKTGTNENVMTRSDVKRDRKSVV